MDPSIPLAILTPIVSVLVALGVVKNQVSNHESRLVKVETKTDTLVGDVREIKTNIQWIRETMERREK